MEKANTVQTVAQDYAIDKFSNMKLSMMIQEAFMEGVAWQRDYCSCICPGATLGPQMPVKPKDRAYCERCELEAGACPEHSREQSTKGLTVANWEVKGVHYKYMKPEMPEGWEPFGVTEEPADECNEVWIWLRRKVETPQASDEEDPIRP